MKEKVYIIKHFVSTHNIDRDAFMLSAGVFSTFEKADTKAKELYQSVRDADAKRYPCVKQETSEKPGEYIITVSPDEGGPLTFSWTVVTFEVE